MQLKFGDPEGLGQRRHTQRERFLAEMNQIVPWKHLVALIQPHYPQIGVRGRQPYPLATMVRVHLLQQWYALSDLSIEEALHDSTVMRRFAGISGVTRIPDETTIHEFRQLLETQKLAAEVRDVVDACLQNKDMSVRPGTIVDASIRQGRSSSRKADKAREPKARQVGKGTRG